MLHEIFQRLGIPPHEVYNAPDGSKRFMYASMALVLEEEKKLQQRQERQASLNDLRRKKRGRK